MKAMIFAAGLGTRLYPITKEIPKALAPFGKTTLLGYNLNYLSKQGIDNFIINTHHFANKIENYLAKNNNFGLKIELSYEPQLLDTAGGLAKAIPLFGEEENILLYNVDIISNINIKAMMKYHLENNSAATLAVRKRNTSRYLLFDDDNILVGWKNKNTNEEKWCNNKLDKATEYAFSGIHIINKSLFNKLATIKQSLIPFYLKSGSNNKIIAFQHSNDLWFDCGKPKSLKTAESSIYIK